MDYKSDGVASSYWEISRELKFWKGPLSAHLEYNGGLPYVKNAYLSGVTYSHDNAGFTRGFNFYRGHPAQEVLDRYKSNGAVVLRNDLQGAVGFRTANGMIEKIDTMLI